MRSPWSWRVLLGAVLLAALLGAGNNLLNPNWYKLKNPLEFATAVAQYRMLPAPLVNGFALWLPALELVVGLGLVTGRWKKECYALTAALWVMFIIALGQALGRRLGITCGCFAIEGVDASVGETWFSLLRDLVLLVPTVALLLRVSPAEQHEAAALGAARTALGDSR